MLLEKIMNALKNMLDPVNTELGGVRFRGEEQGRFRFKYKAYEKYAGDFGKNETPVSKLLRDAIFYANERASLRRYDENTNEIYPCKGFPLVMAIDITPYLLKPGIEPNEEVIIGETYKKDIFVLFDDKTDYFKGIISNSWHSSLIFQQKQARKTERIKKEIRRLKILIKQ